MRQLCRIFFLILLLFVSCSKKDNDGDPDPGDKLTDEQLMDLVQEHTFKYFLDFAHPVSGLARERSNGNNDIVTIGGSGFGVMVIIVGLERGYITREEGLDHLLKMVRFLRDKCTRYHGAWAHWVNGTSGETIPFSDKDDGGDLVETAFMIQGLLTARQYFNLDSAKETEIRFIISELWNEVEWDWYTNGGDFLFWHWSPNYGWEMNLPVRGFNETMITYLLAIASPTHPVEKTLYDTGWAGDNYEATLVVDKDGYYGGPLFFTHYSYLGFDPRFSDKYIEATRFDTYFHRNREQTLLNRKWCIDRSGIYKYYNDSCWGLTASDDPVHGYLAHEPTIERDNGTLTPTAAISSIVYTPAESLAAVRHFYETYGDAGLWGLYGFEDAFNIDRAWYSNSYLAIDQGPIVIMIENYRSGILWNTFMRDPDIMEMVEKMDFIYKF
jgi:hypothetical protein